MTDTQPGSYKFCQHCGQQMQKQASTCPSCGKSIGMSRTVLVIIVLAVVGVVGFGSLVVIGILAAIALPNFIGAQQKAMTSMVKANMRTCQIAAESYATDAGGAYPQSINDNQFRSYFPAGSNGTRPYLQGSPPTNPCTRRQQWPIDGNITDVNAARNSAPSLIGKGVVEYSVIYDSQHDPVSYAIRGGNPSGQTITGSGGKILVLSNQ